MGAVVSIDQFRQQIEEGEIAARTLEKHSRAHATRRAYGHHEREFKKWARGKGLQTLPAYPDDVRRYLALLDKQGYAASTIVVAAAAIQAYHEDAGYSSPTTHPKVKGVMRGIKRRPSAPPKQAKGLTAKDMEVLRAWAYGPVQDLRFHSAEQQRKSRLITLALAGTMRDSMLRRSEAAAITWDDIEPAEDGSGALLIRRSKTDQTGQGAYGYLSRQTMKDLAEMRRRQQRSAVNRLVFRLKPWAIAHRLKEHCKAAGLEGEYSGHSPRVGACQDMARAGLPDYLVQLAGRWSSPAMVAKYTRGIRVNENGMARWYAMQEEGMT